MQHRIEDVYTTEGVPEFTFISPPNYNQILVDLRTLGKPVIIEGQSGTGKTTVVRKILTDSLPQESFEFLSARKSADFSKIIDISDGKLKERYIIDDFHRLDDSIQEKIANIVKLSAEEPDTALYPKLVLIGINKVGSELILMVPDIAKRCGIHRVAPASVEGITALIVKGEGKLNIEVLEKSNLIEEAGGDYWLAQLLCQSLCLLNDITETSETKKYLNFNREVLRERLVAWLESSYANPVKEFCRGQRFRSSNDPYYKLLKLIAEQDNSIVDLNELANAYPEFKGSINNIKEGRIATLLDSKQMFNQYFYYNSSTKSFAIEDPALFYYIKHLDWEALRKNCGFRQSDTGYEFDFAISFAGENRELAKNIADLLAVLDCNVFYDSYYEANYLGTAWSKQFKEVFVEKSRFVVCLLDVHHSEKIWPTFERECFQPRVQAGSVIPVYLDDTVFIGIPQDIVGISFKGQPHGDEEKITDDIVYKLEKRLENV